MDDEDRFTTLDFNISLNRASISTPVLPHEGDLLKGIFASYGVPVLGEFWYTRLNLQLEVEHLVQIQATVLLLKDSVPQAMRTLCNLQDEGKIVHLVYGA